MELSSILNSLAKYLIIAIVIILIIYFLICILINKYHKLYYGEGTIRAFIPIFNIYLLGKLASGSAFGSLLLILIFFTSSLSLNVKKFAFKYSDGNLNLTINNHKYFRRLLPPNIISIMQIVLLICILLAIVIVIIRYIKLKHSMEIIDYDPVSIKTSNTIQTIKKEKHIDNKEKEEVLPINTNDNDNNQEFDTSEEPDFVKNNNVNDNNQNNIISNEPEVIENTSSPTLDNIAPGMDINTESSEADKPAIEIDTTNNNN